MGEGEEEMEGQEGEGRVRGGRGRGERGEGKKAGGKGRKKGGYRLRIKILSTALRSSIYIMDLPPPPP